ncbi:MAG: hypothetical protein JO345_07520 [Streptosporangiaceae bacterium]|nr:hypothetical protein [Streptosporangiaceae bacterium]
MAPRAGRLASPARRSASRSAISAWTLRPIRSPACCRCWRSCAHCRRCQRCQRPGTPGALEGDIPAAQVHELRQQIPPLTRGEGVMESSFDRYKPVRRCFWGIG